MPKHPEALWDVSTYTSLLHGGSPCLGKQHGCWRPNPSMSNWGTAGFYVSQKPLALTLQINLEVIMTIKELGIVPTLKSEHKHHSAHLREKQMFLILHQAVQQAGPEQRIWVVCTIWPPTRQVSYLLLHTKAHPGAGSSPGTCQPPDLWPIWQEWLETLFTARCHFWLCVFQLLCWTALSSPMHIKGCTDTNTSFTSCSAVYYNKGVPGMLLNISLTIPKLASACVRIKIWKTKTTSHNVGGWR